MKIIKLKKNVATIDRYTGGSSSGQSEKGFSNSSAGKESSFNSGDTGSIPGSGRFPGEGIAYPLQCSWVSLVAQLVKNPPAMRKTWL